MALALVVAPCGADWLPFPPDNTPLCDPSLPTDFAYRGQADAGRGLYPSGTNTPSGEILATLERRHAEIEPINGVIGIAAIGMSNTTQAFGAFERDVRFREKNARVVTANLAMAGSDIRVQAGQDPGDPYDFCDNWNAVHPDEVSIGQTCDLRHIAFWQTAYNRLNAYGIDPAQIQIVWLSTSLDSPLSDLSGDDDCADGLCWRTEVEEVSAGWGKIIGGRLAQFFPNLKVIYLSGRNYGGYQQEGVAPEDGNPEPFSYELGFAVKWLLEDYERLIIDSGGAELFPGPAIAWGPYLWANGVETRACDLAYDPPGGLFWLREDFDVDGFHPDPSGETKVAELLAEYLTNDPLASEWFLAPAEPDAVSYVIDATEDTATNGVQVGPTVLKVPLAPGFSSYLKIPTAEIPPDADIVAAHLYLRMDDSRESRLLDVDQIANDWDESATASELMSIDVLAPIYSYPSSPTTVADPDGSIGIDVRSAVEAAITTGEPLAFRVSARFNPCVAGHLTRDYSHPARPFDDPPYLAVVTE